ncbi:membrane protein [Gordonia phthalatica]|uniref:Membrane protein n=2 Tax=Gordonia phthalatica TaxID=1136941 RepID=A0A0N9NA54_9ACTN|nr:MspA family porin [Gordonia phthalatica]ALG83883.1 membrane protein [Gordonia phthalatica]
MNKRILRGVTASAAVAGAALMGATMVPAPANAAPVPGTTKVKNFSEGSVTIKLYDQSARVSRAVTNIPTSREVMVSGKVRVATSGGVKGGAINAGYIVGCQLTFGASAGANGGVNGGFDKDGNYAITATPKDFGGNGTIVLGPGQAGYVPIIVSKSDDKVTNSFGFGAPQGGVAFSGERFGVDGCAGYAQARAKVTVRVATDTFVGNVTLYGRPFSIG